MDFVSKYKAHVPDADGMVDYSAQENRVWSLLYNRQEKLWTNRACDDYLIGLEKLKLTKQSIPQLPDINLILSNLTGWQLEPVAALISAREFFELLSQRKFPAATFIRTEEELDYVQEPDIFHELIGHCPMLTNQVYADFLQDYSTRVLEFPEKNWPLLQRLFWFTVEFGLIYTPKGLRIYGGGILSSIDETVYSVESNLPQRILFDPLAIFRTPYRIDQKQKVYFVIHEYKQLYDFLNLDIQILLEKAYQTGEFPPLFDVDKDISEMNIRAC
ncbi:MAG: phenylalanine 4-monooxygenase [Legionellaceae bacterium]|nr:phenylalanine 4-monooxygenase [Legionellaceae bacterium]